MWWLYYSFLLRIYFCWVGAGHIGIIVHNKLSPLSDFCIFLYSYLPCIFRYVDISTYYENITLDHQGAIICYSQTLFSFKIRNVCAESKCGTILYGNEPTESCFEGFRKFNQMEEYRSLNDFCSLQSVLSLFSNCKCRS